MAKLFLDGAVGAFWRRKKLNPQGQSNEIFDLQFFFFS